ncbi:MAG TPA: hypothetical protein VM778_12260 [Gemmatimonadota bacterium]|nr:hypothetical protein [Gemmatimonadota bacterium]
MRGGELPLVFTLGERAVAHSVDPAVPAGEVPGLLALYLGGVVRGAEMVHLASAGERRLDPLVAIGAQVGPDDEIELRAV